MADWSAAELFGASCAPLNAPAEVARPRLIVHRDTIAADELTELDGLVTTTQLRTARDLARRLDLVEAVVAVDRIAIKAGFAPNLLRYTALRYPRARGNAQLATVLAHADARSGSPPESRLRMVIVLAGLRRRRRSGWCRTR